jgi:hypothetical protein
MTAGDPGECTHVHTVERMLSSLRCLLATILSIDQSIKRSIDRLFLAPLSLVSDSPRDQNSASEESARTLLSPAQRMTLVLAPLLVVEIRCGIPVWQLTVAPRSMDRQVSRPISSLSNTLAERELRASSYGSMYQYSVILNRAADDHPDCASPDQRIDVAVSK